MTTNTQHDPADYELALVPGASIKAAMKAVSAASRDNWQVPINEIHVLDGFNIRVENDEYWAGIRELADAIKADGFYQHKPLAGYLANIDGKQVICLFDGHRRYKAARLAIDEGAEIEFLPMVVSKDGVSNEDLTVALVKTNTGKPLSPYEIGIVCKRLTKFGHDVKGVASRLGLTPTYVTQLLSLMASAPDIQRRVANNEVSANTAIEIVATHGAKASEVLIEASIAAKTAGKSKVTAKHLPGAVFQKTLKRSSETMFQTLEQVCEDPGFASLSDDIRGKLSTMIDMLKKAKDA